MYYFTNPTLDTLITDTQLVIFDMNGLIVDDESFQLQAYNEILKQYNVHVSEDEWVSTYVGHRSAEILRQIMEMHHVGAVYDIVHLVREKNELYRTLIAIHVIDSVRPGVLDLIDFLKTREQKLAVATSASQEEVDSILGCLGVKDEFDVIICGDEVTKPKPDPEIYLTVSKKMGVEPNECVVFEDTEVGVHSAVSAGMKCIAVPNRFTLHQDFSKADFVLNNLTKDALNLI